MALNPETNIQSPIDQVENGEEDLKHQEYMESCHNLMNKDSQFDADVYFQLDSGLDSDSEHNEQDILPINAQAHESSDESDDEVDPKPVGLIDHKQAYEKLNELRDYFMARKDDCKKIIENLNKAEIRILTRKANKQSSIDNYFRKS